jgi:hypothetical protein
MRINTMKRKVKSHRGPALLIGLLSAAAFTGPSTAFAQDVAACATATSLTAAAGASPLVSAQPDKLIIAIRPDQPRVGRPVIAWIVGHQPGHLLVARQISWKFNNAASMLKGGGGGSSSTIYLSPGFKKITVAVTDMSGARRKAACSFTVTW